MAASDGSAARSIRWLWRHHRALLYSLVAISAAFWLVRQATA